MSKELNFYEALEVMRKGGVVNNKGTLYKIGKDNIFYYDITEQWKECSFSIGYYTAMTFTEEPKPVKMADKWLWADKEFTYTNFLVQLVSEVTLSN